MSQAASLRNVIFNGVVAVSKKSFDHGQVRLALGV
jgi:hypothetical protein